MKSLCLTGEVMGVANHDELIVPDTPSSESYLCMNEEEKNSEIMKAIIRLHNLMFTIRFLSDEKLSTRSFETSRENRDRQVLHSS